jgi:hypothetical protein
MAKRVSLFKVLRRDLGPQLEADGFAEVPQDASSRNCMLMYFRDASRGTSLGFWFQRNVKSAWVDALGSSFTVEFFRSLEDPYEMDERERVYHLLTGQELEEMRELQNRMIRRLPPIESILKPWEVQMFGQSIERDRQLETEPFHPGHEEWMRYRDEEDIQTWTSFLGRILPSLVERFDAKKPRTT